MICTKCHKSIGLFSRKYNCRRCGKTFCSTCIDEVSAPKSIMNLLEKVNNYTPEFSITKFAYVLCPKCAVHFNNTVRQMEVATTNTHRVELVSCNYHGRKPYTGTPIPISTDYYKDKSDAEEELKILAKYHNCNMVINTRIYKERNEEKTEKGGTYVYTTWSYTGDAVKKI